MSRTRNRIACHPTLMFDGFLLVICLFPLGLIAKEGRGPVCVIAVTSRRGKSLQYTHFFVVTTQCSCHDACQRKHLGQHFYLLFSRDLVLWALYGNLGLRCLRLLYYRLKVLVVCVGSLQLFRWGHEELNAICAHRNAVVTFSRLLTGGVSYGLCRTVHTIQRLLASFSSLNKWSNRMQTNRKVARPIVITELTKVIFISVNNLVSDFES